MSAQLTSESLNQWLSMGSLAAVIAGVPPEVALGAAVGWAADKSGLPPIITLITFSAISLVCGFIYSKFIVFKDAK
jgi:MFS family permease